MEVILLWTIAQFNAIIWIRIREPLLVIKMNYIAKQGETINLEVNPQWDLTILQVMATLLSEEQGALVPQTNLLSITSNASRCFPQKTQTLILMPTTLHRWTDKIPLRMILMPSKTIQWLDNYSIQIEDKTTNFKIQWEDSGRVHLRSSFTLSKKIDQIIILALLILPQLKHSHNTLTNQCHSKWMVGWDIHLRRLFISITKHSIQELVAQWMIHD